MTQPLPPEGFTAADAAVALAAAQAALAARDAVAATVLDMSTAVIAAREAAAAYAKVLIGALWATLDPYDGNAVQDFTTAAAGHMVTAQTTTARTAAAAQSAILQTMGIALPGVSSTPVDLRGPGADVLAGRLTVRDPDDVRIDYGTRGRLTVSAEDMTTEGMFNRPARTLRAVEAEGASREEADAQARGRIDRLVEDNVMLAQRFAESEVLQRAVDLDVPGPEIIGYRRVIHPEMSRTGVCGLCIAAADQRYKVGTLMPIHARCWCTIAAITEEHDPANDVNAADLGALYDAAGSTAGADLKRVRYQVDEHGELGPVLVPKKRQPKKRAARRSAPAASTESKADIAARQLPLLEANLVNLREQGLGDSAPQVEYHQRQIERLRGDLVDAGARLPAASGGGGGGGVPPRQNPPINGGGGGDDGANRLDRLFADQTSAATPKQRESVQRWQGKDEKFYQQVQRTASGDLDSEEALDVVEDLDELMMPLPEDVEAWRGIRNCERTFGVPSAQLGTLVGRSFDSPMYFATSLDRNVAEDEFIVPGRDPVVYKVIARAGTPAVWVPPLGAQQDAYQQELLLAAGVGVRILDVSETDDGVPLLTVEVTSGTA